MVGVHDLDLMVLLKLLKSIYLSVVLMVYRTFKSTSDGAQTYIGIIVLRGSCVLPYGMIVY